MADVLEALVQIRALAHTPSRIAALVTAAAPERWARRPRTGVWAPVEVLAHLADAELVFGARLRLVLTTDRPALQPFDGAALAGRAAYLGWPPELALERFRTRRGQTTERLLACSAAELARVGVDPTRGEVTVADLVALALAHDTDHVAQMRERLAAGPQSAAPPAEA
jgi:uncharacterized damage-inducible protein DinB